MSVKIPMSVGSGSPRILIIGEAPGAEEDRMAKPFVGESGQLLRDGLAEFLPKDVVPYITNAVKCRPPQNKLSGAKAIQACRKYLIEDIENCHPDFIFVCGAVPLQSLLGLTGITKLRGTRLSYEASWGAVPVFPIFHPAYILRNIGMLSMWVEDMKRAYRTWDTRVDSISNAPYTEVSLQEFEGYAQHAKSVVYDIETNKCLDPKNPNGFITRIGFCLKDGDKYLVAGADPYKDSWEQDRQVCQRILQLPGVEKVAHHLKFDSGWLLEKYQMEVTPPLFCTLVGFYIGVNEEASNGLKNLAYLYTPYGGYEDKFKSVEESAPSVYPLSWLLEQPDEYHSVLKHYNYMDVVVTHMVYEHVKPIIDADEGFKNVMYNILMPVHYPLIHMESAGIKIDAHLLGQYGRELLRRQAKYHYDAWVALLKAGVKGYDIWFEEGDTAGYLNKPKKAPSKGRYLNLGSQVHLSDILYKQLHLPVVKRTKGGAASSDKEAIELLYDQIEAIVAKGDAVHIEPLDCLVKWRAVSTAYKMFVKPYAAMLDDDFMLHPKYSLTREAKEEYGGGEGTVTGRLSSARPNFQQVPRVVEEGNTRLSKLRYEALEGIVIKKLFVSRFDGGSIIQADYSQIELRWAAILSKDENMIAAFNNGEDIHKSTAAEVFGVPISEVDKDMRRQAKAVNFGILYGKGSKSYAKEWGVSEAAAEQFITQYFSKRPKVKSWIHSVHSQVTRHGFIRTFFGRKRRLGAAQSTNQGIVAAALREAQNANPQASASDMMLITIRRLDELFHKLNLRSVICGTVHDSLVIDSPPDEVQIVAPMVRAIAEDWARYKFPVPILIDVEVGSSWGSTVKIDRKELT
jgi:DNA polymerase-1